jgi:DNA (cytosine-5)-methyltransferase 1
LKSKKIKGHLDLFSGIGGFSLALERSGIKPNWVGFSDIDKYANETFQRRFKDAERLEDITNVQCEDLPEDIDLLTGGFPCQAFSQAGKRLAFEDTRGTLFYEIVRILKYYIEIEKPIKHFVLENVKGLYSAGNYTAFSTIYSFLSDLGYSVECQLLNSKFFGVPQNRERIYFVGRYSPGGSRPKVFPIRQNAREVSKNGEVKFTNSDPRGFGWKDLSPTLAARDYKDPKWVKLNKPDQVGKVCDGDGGRVFSTNGTSCTLKAQGGGWGAKTGLYEVKSLNKNQINKLNKMEVDEKISGTLTQAIGRGGSSKEYLAMLKRNQKITGQIRRLTPIECERLQGFPDNWTDGQSDTQRYKQCGNAITVNVAEVIFRKLYEVRG